MKWFRRGRQFLAGIWMGELLRTQASATANEAQIRFLEDGLIPRVELLLEAGLWKDLVAAVVAVICVVAMFCLALRQKKGANH